MIHKLKALLSFNKRLTNFQILIIQLIIAFIIFSPYITKEFYADDYIFISYLKSGSSYPIFGLWSLDLGDLETSPNIWWKDDIAYGRLFRPLPSLIFYLAYLIFQNFSALILHILSIFLHALVSFSVFLMLFKLSKIYSVSLLASFIFLISEDHSMTVGWISSSTDIFAVLFINLSIYFHVKFRESNLISQKRVSQLFMTLSFLCKETAVIGPVAIILYEFILLESQSGIGNIFKRLLNKLILLVKNQTYWRFHFILLFVYLLFYRLTGFGVNILMYIDPFRKPDEYIKNLIIGLPIMFTGFVTNFPFGIVLFEKSLLYPLMIVGIVLYVVFSFSFIPFWKLRLIHFSFMLFTISLFPQLITFPSERLIYFPFAIGSFLIAFQILNSNLFKSKFLPDFPYGIKYFNNIIGYYFMFSTIIGAFILSIYLPGEYIKSFKSIERTVDETFKLVKGKSKEIIFLTTPDIFHTFYLNDTYKVKYDYSSKVYPLSSFDGEMRIKKIDAKSLILETNDDGWIDNFFAKIVRVYKKVDVGKKFETGLFTATILKTKLSGDEIYSAKFEFKTNLSDKHLAFLYFNGHKLNRLDPDTLITNNWYVLREMVKNE